MLYRYDLIPSEIVTAVLRHVNEFSTECNFDELSIGEYALLTTMYEIDPVEVAYGMIFAIVMKEYYPKNSEGDVKPIDKWILGYNKMLQTLATLKGSETLPESNNVEEALLYAKTHYHMYVTDTTKKEHLRMISYLFDIIAIASNNMKETAPATTENTAPVEKKEPPEESGYDDWICALRSTDINDNIDNMKLLLKFSLL